MIYGPKTNIALLLAFFTVAGSVGCRPDDQPPRTSDSPTHAPQHVARKHVMFNDGPGMELL
ncbi:MAG TPA: hypothetical protein VKB78_06475, partial [Pirellulales bacterium]|nr:hypothetical protein [Pirellulales bacterium]